MWLKAIDANSILLCNVLYIALRFYFLRSFLSQGELDMKSKKRMFCRERGVIAVIALIGFVMVPYANASTATLTFARDAHGYSVTGFTGVPRGSLSGALTIPASHNGRPVISIRSSAFANNQLTSVTIPGSINSIGAGAFRDNRLASITIGSGVTHIGGDFGINGGAFSNNLLTNVTIPDSVTHIGDFAFAGNLLTNITIGNSVIYIGSSHMGGSFRDNVITSVTIPDSVTHIRGGSFQNNQLTSVTIGNSVTHFGGGAFTNNSLSSVTVPSGVIVGDNVFDRQVTVIGSKWLEFARYRHGYAVSRFVGTTNEVIIPDSHNGRPVIAIRDSVFANNQLTNAIIPDSVIYIGNAAFRNNRLTSVTIGSGVTHIRGGWSGGAFQDNMLTNVIIPDRVTSIGDFAFAGNPLASVNVPEGVGVANNAFDQGVTVTRN